MGRHDFWYCEACKAQNHVMDGECQFCECGGKGICQRDNCSDIRHFYSGMALLAARMRETQASMEKQTWEAERRARGFRAAERRRP